MRGEVRELTWVHEYLGRVERQGEEDHGGIEENRKDILSRSLVREQIFLT